MSKRKYVIRNKWSQDMLRHERAYYASGEAQMNGAHVEAINHEHYPRITCGACGSDADFHSGIGAYRCFEGGHLEVNGVWR